jgi:lathosterol oxidase
MTFTIAESLTLVVVGVLGHVMALFWYMAVKFQWGVCGRCIYDLPISPVQIRRELKNSVHAPIHAVLLTALLALGFFRGTGVVAFVWSAALAIVWAEIWHYASHRAFHLPSLHWIHEEHHLSHLNTWLTAISFSFTEKLIFDAGFLGLFVLLGRVMPLNFFGIAAWYMGYLVVNSFSHANFEIKSSTYVHGLGTILTSTTYHSLHHSRYNGNYGLGTRFLDQLFGTEWEDYERFYDRVARMQKPLRRLSDRCLQ